MSRIGTKEINIEKADVKVEGDQLIVKGKLGTINLKVFPEINIIIEGSTLRVSRKGNDKKSKELHGLSRALIYNAVFGVTEGYVRKLMLKGIGYRVQKKGKNLEFSLGYSHPVLYKAANDIEFDVEGQEIFLVKSIHKELVGQVCAEIKSLPKRDDYKGKGIFFENEVPKKKPGKSVK